MKLRDMRGLGPQTERYLIEAGIETPDQLRQIGALEAYMKLKENPTFQPNLNFLYALAGAIEDRSWLEIAKMDRDRLILELDARMELED